MKRILITLLTILLAISLIGQERELSDYEKYRIKIEQEIFSKKEQDTIKTDIIFVVEEQQFDPVIINNYYEVYNEPNLRFLTTFGSLYRPYYQPYYYDYWYWNNYYYWGWNWNRPYYYSWHYRPYHYHWYHHNYWDKQYYNYSYVYYAYNKPNKPNKYNGRRITTPTNKYNGRRITTPTNRRMTVSRTSTYVNPKNKNIRTTHRVRTGTNKPIYSKSRQSYTSTYKSPRISMRPVYNNSNRSTYNVNTNRNSRSSTYNSSSNSRSRSTFTNSSTSSYRSSSSGRSRSSGSKSSSGNSGRRR